jgi:hypothetical protein
MVSVTTFTSACESSTEHLQLSGQHACIFWRSHILIWAWHSTMRFFMVFLFLQANAEIVS